MGVGTYSKIYKPKERVKSRPEEREEITHTRNDLREDKSNEPNNRHNRRPNTPPNNSIRVRMSRIPHNPEIHEFGRDISVDNANNNRRHDHESKARFLVGDDAERAECGRGGVLA